MEPYGRTKAKIDLSVLDRLRGAPDGKLVCVTAITPTKAGEGKTTTSVSLTQGLGHVGRRPVLCLREASLGPVFGIKGGAAGGGYAQVVPMEDLNLHFTGDIHAIGAANNLLAALLEAHILHGNALGIDPLSVGWRRCVDINDRALRNVVVGVGGRANGYVRESGFDITAASEVMAIVAVARDLQDLRERLGAITVAYTFEGEPVSAERLRAAGAMTVLLKDALKPNLVQTLEGQPALVHCGPFANIAHGNNSLVADLVALKLGEYVVTESGFGADMGMEKFLNIVCRVGDLSPSAVVLVATAKALKHHGGDPDGGLDAIERGAENLRRHLEIVSEFGLRAVVAVNRFPGDTDEEVELVRRLALEHGAHAAELNEAFERGGAGAADLAEAVVDAADHPNAFEYTYPIDAPIDAKIEAIARRVYGAGERPLPPDGKGQDQAVHRQRPRRAADLHGEDAPLALARSVARERADRIRGDRARRARVHRAPAGSSRSAGRCRRCPGSAPRPRRSASTSTRTGARLGSSSFLDSGLKEFLDAVPARTPAPGGGAVAAVTLSLAAGSDRDGGAVRSRRLAAARRGRRAGRGAAGARGAARGCGRRRLRRVHGRPHRRNRRADRRDPVRARRRRGRGGRAGRGRRGRREPERHAATRQQAPTSPRRWPRSRPGSSRSTRARATSASEMPVASQPERPRRQPGRPFRTCPRDCPWDTSRNAPGTTEIPAAVALASAPPRGSLVERSTPRRRRR